MTKAATTAIALLGLVLVGVLPAQAHAMNVYGPVNGCTVTEWGYCMYTAAGPGVYEGQAAVGRVGQEDYWWAIYVNGSLLKSGKLGAEAGTLPTKKGDVVEVLLRTTGISVGGTTVYDRYVCFGRGGPCQRVSVSVPSKEVSTSKLGSVSARDT